MQQCGTWHPSSPSVKAIREALKQASYNKSKAASLLGISRRTLYRRLEERGIRT